MTKRQLENLKKRCTGRDSIFLVNIYEVKHVLYVTDKQKERKVKQKRTKKATCKREK